jgi:hypothetical protein
LTAVFDLLRYFAEDSTGVLTMSSAMLVCDNRTSSAKDAF